jgi:RsiW-degrading membrane proteinase PrsW (M82 family)
MIIPPISFVIVTFISGGAIILAVIGILYIISRWEV